MFMKDILLFSISGSLMKINIMQFDTKLVRSFSATIKIFIHCMNCLTNMASYRIIATLKEKKMLCKINYPNKIFIVIQGCCT